MMIWVASIVLLVLSAALSGVMAALLPLNTRELKRKAELGHLQARAVLPLKEQGSQLFVTLLLADTLVNATLVAVMVGGFAPWLAVLYATLLIIVFGEALPRAVLGRYGLRVGSHVAPALHYLMLALYPLAKPLGLLLDRRLGSQDPPFMSREELIKLIEQHSQSDDSDISTTELRVVTQALAFSTKRIAEHMTPRKDITAVKEKDKLTLKLMDELHESGYARVPVTAGSLDHVSGLLYLRDVATQPHKQATVADLMTHQVCYLPEEGTFQDAVEAFMRTKCHLFIVVNESAKTVGLITIEDVITELTGKPETSGFDRYDDAQAVAERYA